MSVIIVLAALALLMLAAYRGYSVILFAPIAALGAVLLTDPSAVAPAFTGVFMEKMVGFIKLYFPVFLLGAVFGKDIVRIFWIVFGTAQVNHQSVEEIPQNLIATFHKICMILTPEHVADFAFRHAEIY